jgi:16S rRNA (cytosine967-C5)-methyltransferase
VNLRVLAWRILLEEQLDPLRLVDPSAEEEGLEPRDRALLRRIVGTEVRRRGTLRALVRTFAHGRPSREITLHLHVGLVQIYFLDQIPDHAAVGETVSATKETLGAGKGAYVNAVLRRAIDARRAGSCGNPKRDLPERDVHVAESLFPDPQEHPLLWIEDALSMPVSIARGWVRRLGEERAFALARSALVESDLSLRVAGDREEIARELESLGCKPRRAAHPRVLLVDSGSTEAVVRSTVFTSGRVTVQGETALRAAELLEARSGERILELCAAPGGKTLVLAQGGARVLATDSNPARLQRAQENLRRLATPEIRDRVDLVACDGARGVGEATFDGVLLDAPCSNTGVLAQRPAARWRYSADSRRSLGILQDRLLAEAGEHVRPGGRLVYSTCSIEPEENLRRVEAFLATRPGFALEARVDALPDPRGELGPVDGGFAARLRRSSAG